MNAHQLRVVAQNLQDQKEIIVKRALQEKFGMHNTDKLFLMGSVRKEEDGTETQFIGKKPFLIFDVVQPTIEMLDDRVVMTYEQTFTILV